MERRGDLRARATVRQIVVHGRDQVGACDHAARDGAGVRHGRLGAGQLLQLDRRLALVAHPLAHAQHRRSGVEQPAHARRERRVHAEDGPQLRPAGERHRPPGRLEVGGGGAPRLADRGGAARQRHRLEVGDTLEPLQVAAQELAAPERPVRAVAGAVEDERERRAGADRARPGRRRRGRGGAAPRSRRGRARAPTGSRGSPDACRTRSPRAARRASPGRARGRPGRRGRRPRSRGRRGAARGTRSRPGRRRTCSSARRRPPRSAGARARAAAATTGVYPRERRIGKAARTTESSQRRWIGRSCARNASAIPSEALAGLGVGRPRSARRSGCRSS